jgi:hypothetical protein
MGEGARRHKSATWAGGGALVLGMALLACSGNVDVDSTHYYKSANVGRCQGGGSPNQQIEACLNVARGLQKDPTQGLDPAWRACSLSAAQNDDLNTLDTNCTIAMGFFRHYKPDIKTQLANMAYRQLVAMVDRQKRKYPGAERGLADIFVSFGNDIENSVTLGKEIDMGLVIAEQSPNADRAILQWAAKSNCEWNANSCEMAAKYGGQVDANAVAVAAQKEQEQRDEIRRMDREDKESRDRIAASTPTSPILQGIVEGLQNVQNQPGPVIVVPPRTVAPTVRTAPSSRPHTNGGPTGTTIGVSHPAIAPGQPQPGTATGGNGGQPATASAPDCTNMNAFVKVTSAHPTGLGHCDREIVATVHNFSSGALDCKLAYYDGTIRKGDTAGFPLKPGQVTGGEGSGLWSCGATTIKYACVPQGPQSGLCPVNF